METILKFDMKKAIWQLPAILTLSVALGLGVNFFRPDGIPLVRHWNTDIMEQKAAEGLRVIPLEEAVRLYREQQAVFIDARPQTFYAEGHIKGAVNLPWNRAEELFIDVLTPVPPEETVITYCDGISCDLSENLAEFLTDIGYTDVYVLPDGWNRWKAQGLPTGP